MLLHGILMARSQMAKNGPGDFQSMKLALTIDVEEEGLFQDQYSSGDAPTKNVDELMRLDPIFTRWEIHPTLLVSYQVIRHPRYQESLAALAEKWGAEIGLHLHPWNTPPLEPLPYPEPVPSELMPKELLAAKLQTLLETTRRAGIEPTSFRMGRFNMGRKMFAVIQETPAIQVDSSVAPFRKYYGGPAQLGFRTDPYFPDPQKILENGASRLLEVPITIVPLIPGFGRLLARLDEAAVFPKAWMPEIAAKVASLPVQPMWTGLHRMKAAVRMHWRRGGKVLTTHFHSSEIMAGGCPQHATEQQVDWFLQKLGLLLEWLRTECQTESTTLSELGALYRTNRDAAG